MRTDRAAAACLLVAVLCLAPHAGLSQATTGSEPADPPGPAAKEGTPKPAAEKAPPKPEKSRPPPKAFQPSDKIPADVPSTFPTDI